MPSLPPELPAKPSQAIAAPRVVVPGETLARVRELYERGLGLQAYEASKAAGDLKLWDGEAARIMAGRLAANLGGYRMSRMHHRAAWRANRADPDCIAYHGHTVLQARGPVMALEFLERFPPDAARTNPDARVHWLSLRVMVLAHLRDFAAAEECLFEAEALSASRPWLETSRSHLLELQDRYPEALAAARASLELRPWYRPGVQAVLHTLQLLDQHEEALEFGLEAERHLENMHVTRQVLTLQIELGKYAEAFASYQRLCDLAPLIEKGERKWIDYQKIRLNCLRGEFAMALAATEGNEDPPIQELAAKLKDEASPKRCVRLEVPFVRQHHLTCVPATLAAISRYWQQPAEHLEIAEAICYDGTPAHSERRWALDHGWVTREFTVTWEAARQLLDRGIPFTLTTSEATSGHLQAVIGYDELRHTLWIRDPFVYTTGEGNVKPLLERYRATGPRGMAMVPVDRAELLEGLELPDQCLYDRLFELQEILAAHRRAEAASVLEQMQASSPEHRLTLSAERALASYDSNTPRLLACLERLIQQFPDDENLTLSRLSCLRDLARREERLQILEQMSQKRGVDPVFWQQYAQELRQDAGQLDVAATWTRWALRYRPTDPTLLNAWGDVLWERRDFKGATRYYRLAACTGEKREQFTRTFFIAARHLKRVDDALKFMRDREQQLGAKSSEPAITLVESLNHLGRTQEALEVLSAALQRRPQDGALHLFAADFNGRYSRFAEANRFLEAAHGCSAPAAWLRAAATLAGYQQQKQAALQHWREVLSVEVLAQDAFQSIALLLAETENRTAALKFLSDACERFPFCCPLLALRISWLKEEGSEVVIQPLRELLAVNPADAWAWRELALHQLYLHRHEEALHSANEAIRLDPHRSHGYLIRGDIRLAQQALDEARADFRKAVTLEVDNEMAVAQLVQTAPTLVAKKEALSVIAEEMKRQATFGNAHDAFRNAARGLLTPEEITAQLKEAHQTRADFWQSWSVLINHLVDTGDLAGAEDLAHRATERFPLNARLWSDLGRVGHAKLDAAAEIAALEQALAISPGYGYVSRLLSSAHQRRNDLARAQQVLEAAMAASPLDPYNHGCLADLLWAMDRKAEAIQRLQHALRLEPGYQWAWTSLRNWDADGKLAEEMAWELTRLRPGEARSWLMLAVCLNPKTQPDELFKALDHALELNPRCEDAYDARARALTELHRFDEALAACEPAAMQPVPVQLRMRAAWIEAQRGNVTRAIQKARATLAEHPDYYFGWQLLSEWLQGSDLAGAIQAAERMVLLAPVEPVPLGYLADLKLRSGDRKGAREVFERAFRLSPTYDYAGQNLFDLQFETAEYEAARQTVEVLERHGKTSRTRARRVQLAVAQEHFHQALAEFEQICADPKAEPWTLAESAKALQDRKRDLDRVLKTHALGENATAPATRLWVRRQPGWRRLLFPGALKAMRQHNAEAARAAASEYLDLLGEAVNKAKNTQDLVGPSWLRFCLWWLLRRHRDWLHADLETWGKVGYVLTCMGRPRPVIQWLQDWRQRGEVESWMLFNLILMYQKKSRFDEALDVLRHMSNLAHSEDIYQHVRSWAAFEEALRGRTREAEQQLAALPQEVTGPAASMHEMARLLIEGDAGLPSDSSNFEQACRERLKKCFGDARISTQTPYVRKSFQRFRRHFWPRLSWRMRGWMMVRYHGTSEACIAAFVVVLPICFFWPPMVVPAGLCALGAVAFTVVNNRRK